MKKKPKLLWQGSIGGDPNNPFMKHPFITLSEKGNLTKKQWKVINEFIKKSVEDNKEAIIEGVQRDLETQWFAKKVETHDPFNSEDMSYWCGYHNGKLDGVREFVETIRLNGCTVANELDAPKTRISLFVVLDQIEKLMETYLQSLDGGDKE